MAKSFKRFRDDLDDDQFDKEARLRARRDERRKKASERDAELVSKTDDED